MAINAPPKSSIVSPGNGWWSSLPVTDSMKARIQAEGKAVEIYERTELFVPGFWRTDQYARAVLSAETDRTYTGEEVELIIGSFRRRQEKVSNKQRGPHIHTRIGEAVLRRDIGNPAAMAEQIGLLIEISEQNDGIKIVPEGSPHNPEVSRNFSVYTMPMGNVDRVYDKNAFGDNVFKHDRTASRLVAEIDLLDGFVNYERVKEPIALTSEDSRGLMRQIQQEWLEEAA